MPALLLAAWLDPRAARAEDAAAPALGARVEELTVTDRIEPDGVLVRTARRAVRLLDASGLSAYSQVGTPYLEANQEAELTALVVEKPDGRRLDLLASAPRDVAPVYPPNLPIYSDLRVLRAAVPSLEVADRLVYETRVRVRPLVEGQVWTDATFEDPKEVVVQLYELDVPAGSRLTVRARPGLRSRFEEEISDGRWRRRWHVTREEADSAPRSAPAEAEHEPDIQVTSFASWDEFGAWWSSLAPPEVDEAVRAKARELTAGITDPTGRLRALHRFVAREIRYLGLPLGLGRYRARPVEEILRTGLGDCKDKNRLLASLARGLGVEVEPVLISASGRKLVDEVPSPLQFDHVIGRARLGSAEIWMDATSEMTPMGTLPPGLRGKRAVAWVAAAQGGSAQVVTTPRKAAVAPLVRSDTVGAIDRDGLIRVRVRWTFVGDDEIPRLVFKYGTAEQKRAAVEGLREEWGDKTRIGDSSSSNPEDLETPFWIEYQAEWPMSATVWNKAWDLWIPVPHMALAEPPEPGEEKGAATAAPPEELEFDATVHQIRTARIEVPEGVRVTPPVPVVLKRDFAEFRSDYRVEGRTLLVERELVPRVEKVPKARFADLRAFREQVLADRRQEFDLAAAPDLVAPGADTADALNDRCTEALDRDAFAEAEKLCRRATELEPRHRWAWNNLGRALRGLRRPDEARAAFERQVEIDPNDQYSYANLGDLAWGRQDFGEAEKQYRRQIEVAPLEAYAYEWLGRLIAANRPEEAATLLGHALKLDPADEDLLARWIALEGHLGRWSAAREKLLEHLDLPKGLEAHASLAGELIELETGALEPFRPWFDRLVTEAEAPLRDLRSAQPTKTTFEAATALTVAWVGYGRMALEAGRYDEAVGYLEGALRFLATPGTALWLAEALRGRGEAEKANLELAAAVHTWPGEARYATALRKAVPDSLQRGRLEDKGREDSWRRHSLSLRLPAAAGTQGRLWLLFGADGAVVDAAAVEGESTAALAAGVKLQAPRVALPAANRLPVPARAAAFCNSAGECTLMLDPPSGVWYELAGAAAAAGRN